MVGGTIRFLGDFRARSEDTSTNFSEATITLRHRRQVLATVSRDQQW